MSYKQKPQETLQLAAYLFLLIGLVSLVEMVVRAARGTFHFNFGIIGLGIFMGLRRYSSIWRIAALIFTWCSMIVVGLALFLCLYAQPPAVSAMPQPGTAAQAPMMASTDIPNVPVNWAAFPLIMLFLIALWQYRVLTHPAIRRMFIPAPVEAHALETTESPAAPEADGVTAE